MTKENFIEFLKLATPQEINKYIEEKGKQPRLRKVYVNIN